MIGTWAQVEDVKGEANGRGKSDTGSRKELIGLPSRGGNRRLAVVTGRRGVIQVDGRYAARRDRGVEAYTKRERSGVDR